MIARVFRVLNEMRKRGIIGRYAVGGGVASHFYVQPFYTIDLDVFILLTETPGGPTPLEMIYHYLRTKGYKRRDKYIMIGRIPVEFIHAGNPLLEEALKTAALKKYRGIPIRIFQPEHLVAIALQVGRLKDLARAEKFLNEARLDLNHLKSILRRHKLLRRWQAFLNQSST